MRAFHRRATILVLTAAAYLSACAQEKRQETDTSPEPIPDSQWAYFVMEDRVNRLLSDTSARMKPSTYLIEDVALVPMTSETGVPNMSLLVENGKIPAIGATGSIPLPDGAQRISGNGNYLIPGLTDMHVHTAVSYSQDILHLAKGVTSVREMCGFDWILKVRDKTTKNEWFGPNLHVAGHILNAFPMGVYATEVRTPEQAREAVRHQAKAGYDFIKVHNQLKPAVYAAIFEEARLHRLDVVGHIPQQITIKKAIASGQRTLEHFKGYIFDKDLSLSRENYVKLTRDGGSWNCPTLYNVRAGLRGERALDYLSNAPEARYASPIARREWRDIAAGGGEEATDRVFELSRRIVRELKGQYDRFLAGTDCGGGYPFMVPGIALHEELRLFETLGMTRHEALRCATRNAAEAMRREAEFGTIGEGKRADLVLLGGNPLESTKNLDAIEGVFVRGIWIPKPTIEELLRAIEEIYADLSAPEPYVQPTSAEAEDLVKSFEDLHSRGFVHKDLQLMDLAALLQSRGMKPLAERIQGLMTDSQIP